MKILVTGSRNWTDLPLIRQSLLSAVAETDDENVELIHGTARGADQMCAQVATSLGWRVIGVPANWERDGRRAGFIRNEKMVEMDPDVVLAFQVDNSKGTQLTIDLARKRGLRVLVFSRDSK